MNKFESIISTAIDLSAGGTESNSFFFSIHDHILSQEEARNTIMFYSQAIEENKLDLAEYFENIYNVSFSLLYDKYKENILFYTVYNGLDLCENLNFLHLKEYPDGVETIYKSNSQEDFLKIIKLNLAEKSPFRDIVFDDCDILIKFNYDLTILVYYTEKSLARVNIIKEILLNGGFHEL